jgi:hypothetical protein
MTPEFPYVPLPGSFRGFFRKASLWEGVDHVLSITGSRFNEEYRRFYYRDIQAFIVENRARAGSFGWWSVLLVLLVLAIAAAAENDPPYSWVVLLAVALVILIRLDISLRRSCRFSIQTAVSREPLPSLMRRSVARAAITRLQLRIAAEQGTLPDDIPPREEDVTAQVRPPDPTQPPASDMLAAAAAAERRQSAVYGLNFALAALFILLLNSVFTLWISSGGTLGSTAANLRTGYAFIAIGLIPVFFSLPRIAGMRAFYALRAVLIALIVLAGLRVILGSELPTMLALAGRAPFLPSLMRRYAFFNAALQLTLAAAGLILIFAKWEVYRRGEESSS